MATVQKVKASAVVNLLRHNERTIRSPANRDIDFQRSPENYSLAPDWGISSYDYFKERKEQLYCYNRSDVNVMAGWVVTAPADLPEREKERFFQKTYDFLESRYHRENVIQAIVHRDESGQDHLHFCFIPVVPDLKHGGEKICANDVLTRKELRNFHPDLQSYLERQGVHAKVYTGITKAQGGNRTVKELKKERELKHERQNSRSRDLGRW